MYGGLGVGTYTYCSRCVVVYFVEHYLWQYCIISQLTSTYICLLLIITYISVHCGEDHCVVYVNVCA